MSSRADASDRLLRAFEAAWQAGAVPRVEDFLPAATTGDEKRARLRLLQELVAVDLERRWCRAGANGTPVRDSLGHRPLLEAYVVLYPELGPLTAELVGEEYRVRQRWGDRPALAEYLTRFQRQRVALLALLPRIDAELAEEAALGKRPGRASSATPTQPLPAGAPPGQSISTVAGLMETLRQHQLLSPAQAEELAATVFPDVRSLGRELLRREWLTPFQVNQALQGAAAELIVGPYALLDRLGEGGTGQVFKARHRTMQRVVAVKVIRKDRAADPEVVGRFYREMQVVSKLSHPNVVHAFDAGPIGQTLFLVMEYVQGVDLDRLVKQRGPLPWNEACELIAQAAEGLQHVHEQRLVHRDIKPSNLLIAESADCGLPGSSNPPRKQSAIVKILDLGLARLAQHPDAEENTTSILTPTGAVMMGTPNYMAPEQAGDFHTADIRADIYSLGCTFYFLLTGQPPFPGGTLAQKVVKHMQAEPPRLERTDVPAPVGLVLRRMMAKRPEDRQQTPAEVARDLGPYRTAVRQLTPGAEITPPTKIASAGKLRSRRRLRLALTMLVLLCAGAGVWFLAGLRSAGTVALPRTSSQDSSKPIDDGRWRHAGAVNGVAFVEGGRLLASAGDDGVRIWERTRGRQLTWLEEKAPVAGVATVPGKSLLATAAGETVSLWDTVTWQRRALPRRHTGPVGCLAVSADGKTLATGDRTGTIVLWDLPEGSYRATLKEHTGAVTVLAFAPEGKWLASGSADARIVVWGSEKLVLGGHQRGIRLLGFVQDLTLFSQSDDGVWKSWQKDKELTASSDQALQRLGIQAKDIETLAVAADRKRAVMGGSARAPLLLVELPAVQPRKLTPIPIGSVRCLAFAPDGQTIASGSSDGVVQLWDVATAKEVLPAGMP